MIKRFLAWLNNWLYSVSDSTVISPGDLTIECRYCGQRTVVYSPVQVGIVRVVHEEFNRKHAHCSEGN